MTSSTEIAVKAILSADSTVSQDQVRAALDSLKGTSARLVMPTEEADMLLSRKQVAALVGIEEKTVDLYGKRGIFKRVYLIPPREGVKRRMAQGYSRKSVLDAMRAGMEGVADNGYSKVKPGKKQ